MEETGAGLKEIAAEFNLSNKSIGKTYREISFGYSLSLS
jgi:hypothetical protein